MCQILFRVKIENLEDLFQADASRISPNEIRRIEIDGALVGSRATILSMTTRLIRRLGLQAVREVQALTSGGIRKVTIYSAVRLMIHGRECTTEVAELPNDGPILIGQIPLRMLDLVVDQVGGRVIENPKLDFEDFLEMY